jgi:hypothetical protein
MLSRIGRHTLARMKKREHVMTKEKKSKVDKKDDITIILFFLFYFPDYIAWSFTIKKRRALVYYESFQYFLGERKFPALKKKPVPIIYRIYPVKEK